MKYDPYTGNPIEEPENTQTEDITNENTTSDVAPVSYDNSEKKQQTSTDPLAQNVTPTQDTPSKQQASYGSSDNMYHQSAPKETNWGASSGKSNAQSQTQYDPYTGQPITNPTSYQNTGVSSEAARKDNSAKNLGIAALVLGVVSIVANLLYFCCCPFLTVITGIVGIILGCLAKDSMDNRSSLAKAGIITSSIGLALCIIIFVLLIVFSASLEGSNFWQDIEREMRDIFNQNNNSNNHDGSTSTYDYFNLITRFFHR